MFHKVQEVSALNNFKLKVCFEDATVKIYDVTPLFNKWQAFRALQVDKNSYDKTTKA